MCIRDRSFIGIRVPVLRKFAKEFTKEAECKDFLQQLPHEYYDENMLHGLLISEVKDYEAVSYTHLDVYKRQVGGYVLHKEGWHNLRMPLSLQSNNCLSNLATALDQML